MDYKSAFDLNNLKAECKGEVPYSIPWHLTTKGCVSISHEKNHWSYCIAMCTHITLGYIHSRRPAVSSQVCPLPIFTFLIFIVCIRFFTTLWGILWQQTQLRDRPNAVTILNVMSHWGEGVNKVPKIAFIIQEFLQNSTQEPYARYTAF